jgi:hypothetical protein
MTFHLAGPGFTTTHTFPAVRLLLGFALLWASAVFGVRAGVGDDTRRFRGLQEVKSGESGPE